MLASGILLLVSLKKFAPKAQGSMWEEPALLKIGLNLVKEVSSESFPFRTYFWLVTKCLQHNCLGELQS